jgi:N-methylhydantoinase B/oxoprolinase/acetone carboxylase alpha subunit
LKKLFFGGDETAAEAIKEAVAKSEKDIAELKTLLADTTISAEVRAELSAQLAALEKMQERLTNLADKEGKRWGFFSWRLKGSTATTATSTAP